LHGTRLECRLPPRSTRGSLALQPKHNQDDTPLESLAAHGDQSDAAGPSQAVNVNRGRFIASIDGLHRERIELSQRGFSR
jgi:hypothetical protein